MSYSAMVFYLFNDLLKCDKSTEYHTDAFVKVILKYFLRRTGLQSGQD